MPFWEKSSAEKEQANAAAQQEAEASLRSLQAGELPLQAQRRLREETTEGHKLFTSDLSINEFLLTRQQGYQPLSQVMGSSIYHVGWQGTQSTTAAANAYELTIITNAHQQAAQLALYRLEQEAVLLQAHGVIGVHFSRREYEWGKDLLEYTAIGTAIRLPNAPIPQSPFLSDLSGQEFWALVQAGYQPRGLVTGYCAYYVSLGSFYSLWSQQAITPFSQAISAARKLAMQRVVDMARNYKASGIVGMHIDCERKLVEHGEKPDLFVQFSAIGTAISAQRTGHVIPTPLPTLSFTDLRPGQRGQKRELTLRE